ncbi:MULTISPECIES: oligosaccharide flippase family protein [unclassified Paenibacillus]|uniref:oligosaccharide flippase family protein n=1 Tax=unclassified Paenibacillus TaxID=185978 RepID=UPI002405E494|nr:MULTISPECIES: oligosaccharide flippase family protein [unclassified Paenibacillus]MDF9842631.1 stage V sporulation protein B [Paenibacillus sp. PastF-2]MDF9849162.1 stage V sporulation protein B [Paenibacillus sp. PastM-2]MDF9855792.1 stage V sporulation protein B [Paenibacillus sp. PastF-1]MDH6481004.1 stage V sporulation protein B [Paenibacillus sp. PastH-2]MDH6508483.1 stage V sporulation protein B [Paenibacillus sp. PastM-3]
MKSNQLFKQSAIRISALSIVRGIGLLGRVVLTRLVGAEGIGLYQMAYSFFGLMVTLTGGVPTALALASARRPDKGIKLLIRLSVSLLIWGAMISFLLLSFADDIAGWIGTPELRYAIISLCPAVIIVPVLGLIRGYLQGIKSIGVIATSEVIEQAFRYAVMLMLVIQLLPLGVERAVGYGLYGSSAGAAAAFLILTCFIIFQRSRKLHTVKIKNRHDAFSPMWFIRTALAISATRLFIPLSEFLDSLIVPSRLIAAGHNPSEATAIYGVVYGMAVIIVYAPTLVTGAISHTYSVQLASAWQADDHARFKTLSRNSLCAAWLWGGLCSFFCYVFADELSLYIFHSEAAAQVIRYLSPIPIIVGIRELTTSILWARDIRKPPFLGLLSGLLCSITVQYIFLAVPGLEYIGAAIAVLVLETAACIINVWAITRVMPQRIHIKPLLCDLTTLLAAGIWISLLARGHTGLISLPHLLSISFFYFAAAVFYIYLRCYRKSL